MDILEVLASLGQVGIFVLIMLFGVVRNMMKQARKRANPGSAPQPPTTAAPRPQPVPTTMIPTLLGPTPEPGERRTPGRQGRETTTWGTGYGSAFDRSQQSRDDEALEWGSAFSERGADGEALKWSSPFDDERTESKWGFDETEWGGGFAPKKEIAPTIRVS
jgi:hypothetical protein